MVLISYVMTKLVGKWLKDGLHLTNDGTADNLAVNFMLADNFTKYLNINLSTDFNVNSKFNNDFLD